MGIPFGSAPAVVIGAENRSARVTLAQLLSGSGFSWRLSLTSPAQPNISMNAAMLSLLYGLRPAVGCIEIDVAVVKVGFVVGPQLLHGSQLLVEQFAAHRGFNAMIGCLFEVPNPAQVRAATDHPRISDRGWKRPSPIESGLIAAEEVLPAPITSLAVASAAAVRATNAS
jgi:hypothetical protein